MAEGFAFSGSNGYRATELQHVSDVMRELAMEYDMQKSLSLELAIN
jgi:hypothetical protein